MTNTLMIDNTRRDTARAMAGAGVAAAQVAAPSVPTWARIATATRYVRLAAFSVVMTLVIMTFVEISFALAFNAHLYPFFGPFTVN